MNPVRGIKKEESLRRKGEGGVIKEESWRGKHVKESWRRNHAGGFMKEYSWRKDNG